MPVKQRSSFEDLSEHIAVPCFVPSQWSPRLSRLQDVGHKACGLIVVPRAWTPPFIVIKTSAYLSWVESEQAHRSELLANVSDTVVACTSPWLTAWPTGVLLRSSATTETLNERGANASLELAADYSPDHIAQTAERIFTDFRTSGQHGKIAIIVQARAQASHFGHLSNEMRVSKTINQWMWETAAPDQREGRLEVAPFV